MTIEHVLPQWARRAFDVDGSLTIYAAERTEDPARRRVAGRPSLTLTLRDAICESCNTNFLSQLEANVAPVLTPMMLGQEALELDLGIQKMLATWSVKTSLLLERAFRQNYPQSRPIPGYVGTELEFAWLWEHCAPPPRSLVWIGCWDCQSRAPLTYEPSGADLPTGDDKPLHGHLTTFAVGYTLFQVFSVDFLAAEQRAARSWNMNVPETLQGSLIRIWPERLTSVRWPPYVFANDEWSRIVTWDGMLRPGMG